MLDLASRTPNGARISASGRTGQPHSKPQATAHGGTPRLATRAPASRMEAAATARLHNPSEPPASPHGFAPRRKQSFGRHIAGLLSFAGETPGPLPRRAAPASEETVERSDRGFPPEGQDHPDAAGRWQEYEDHPGVQRLDDDRPLIDITVLIASVWRFRRLVVATTVLGAVAGVLIALSTPHHYYAENRIFVDPREIRLTDDDLRNQLLSTEAMIAMTDSQVEILSSNNVLSKVVDELNLTRDPEFNGSANSGGIAGGLALIRQLFSGTEANKAVEIEAIDNLRQALQVSRDPKTFVINVGVVSRGAEKSALIANTVVETYLDSEDAAQSGLMERTSDAIDMRLEALRSDLNAAERAVENFRAENDLVGVGGELIDDRQVLALNQQLGNARANKVSVRVKAENLAKADVSDIIDGAFPEEFLSANLVELRKQYAQTKANTDSLASRLGPRHPQYVAAKSSLDSIRDQIRSELRRIVASSQAELQRAVQTEQEIASQLAVAKSKSLGNSEELVTLRELERKAAATRQIYEGFLKRSRETSERGNLNTQNVRVISPAEPPLRTYGPSRKIVAIAGTVVGAMLGIAIALAFGFLQIVRDFLPEGGPQGRGRPVRSFGVRTSPAQQRETQARDAPRARPARAAAEDEAMPAMPAEPHREKSWPLAEESEQASRFERRSAPAYEPRSEAPPTETKPQQPMPTASSEEASPPHPGHLWQTAPAWQSPPHWPQHPAVSPAGYTGHPPYPYPAHPGYPAAPQQAQTYPWAWNNGPAYHPAFFPPQSVPPQPPHSGSDMSRSTASSERPSIAEIDRIRADMRELRERIDRTNRRRTA